MALERPEAGYVWLHVPLREAVEVVIVGEVHSWWMHWAAVDRKARRGVRCARREHLACALCEGGQAPRVRYVLPVHVAGALRLVEVGRVQYSTLAMMEENGGLVGRRCVVVREYAAKNAAIVLRPAGRETVSAEQVVDISEFVGQLGRIELAAVQPATLRGDGGSSELTRDRERAAAMRLHGPAPERFGSLRDPSVEEVRRAAGLPPSKLVPPDPEGRR